MRLVEVKIVVIKQEFCPYLLRQTRSQLERVFQPLLLKKLLTFYGTHLHKRLSFNTLVQNGISKSRLTCQAMLLMES